MARINKTADGRNQQLVLEYLENNASDVLVEKINSGNKTLSGCWSFITKEARKLASNNCACVDDQTVFGWAIHYFEEDDIDEAIDKAAEERRKIKAAEEEKKRKEREEAQKKLDAAAEEVRRQKEKEKAEEAARKAAEAEEKRKQKEFEQTGAVKGQTSLFDFFSMEG